MRSMSWMRSSMPINLGARVFICLTLVWLVNSLAKITVGSYCAALRWAVFLFTSGLR